MEAVIYARISADMGGSALGVARQVKDCTAKATALGWSVVEVYQDNDVSASKNVPRPSYGRLMADIASGQVKALVVYDLDRLTRKPRELEDFIDLTDETKVLLANVSGDVDLTNANGRMIARIKGSVARQEADRISERVTRQKKQYAETGKPLGTRYRVFGYDREWKLIPDEITIVKEVFKRVVAGESQNSISRDLKARGIKTVADKPWTPLATSRMTRTAMYAGINVFKGQVLGRTSIPTIIDEPTFEAAQRPQENAGFNTRTYLMSGFLVCDLCKGTMVGSKANGGRRYRCDSRAGGCGRLSIKAEWIDDLVQRYMTNVVLADSVKKPEPVEDYSDALEAIETRIEELQQAGGRGDLALQDLVPALKIARAERNQIIKKQSAVIQQDFFAPIGEYENLHSSAQRAQIKARITHLVVKPGKRSRNFDVSRVDVLLANGDIFPAEAIDVTDIRDYGKRLQGDEVQL